MQPIGPRPGEHSIWMIGRHNGGTIDTGLAQDHFRPFFGRRHQRAMWRRLRAIRRACKAYHRGEQHDERNRDTTPEHIVTLLTAPPDCSWYAVVALHASISAGSDTHN